MSFDSIQVPQLPFAERNSRSFGEVSTQARIWDAEFTESDQVPIDQIRLTESELIFGKNSIPLDQAARTRLLSKAAAPVAYLVQRSIPVQTLALREHFLEGDFGFAPKFVLRNNQLMGIHSGELVELTQAEVFDTVGETLGQAADSLMVSKIERTDERLEVELVSPLKQIEARRGDVVRAGIHIKHSRFGGEATRIQAFNYRLICENGMISRECVASEGIVRTRKLPAGHPNAKELELDQVRRLTMRVWDSLTPRLEELKATTARRADVPQLFLSWFQRARLSARQGKKSLTQMDRALAAWRADGAEETVWAAVNALTQVATHDPDLRPRQRRVLSLLGGLLAYSGVHICDRCFSVLSAPAQSGDAPKDEPEAG